MIGKTFAHYEITELLGRGGMGEVYRARDTQLGRDVALKVLPSEMADDADRIARLRREARTLAALHHPRIASLFGLEEIEGTTLLLMELVEGQDLAQRLERGPVPVEDAVRIGLQIAEGLEVAHEAGIIHRDLKPANVKVSPQGEVKILDFGLARAYAGDLAQEGDLSLSPTISAAMTRMGVILGTAAYMSPEQAKGKPVDRRADIWSFGVILFELLTGKQLFQGETASEIMADVMKSGIDWDRLPPDSPRWLIRMLERCLDRDPNTRLQSIGEARIALSRGGDGQEDEHASVTDSTPGHQRSWLVLAVAVLALAATVVWFGLRERPPQVPGLRFQLTNPHVANLRQGGGRHVAISPDGTRVVTIGAGLSEMVLLMRRLDSFEWNPITGTEDAGVPVFSPDGRWLAFLGNRSLSKVNLNGGAPIQLLEASGFIQGMSWADDGYVYGSSGGEFWRVPEAGGEREVVHVMGDEHVGQIGAPHVLPGSRALLFHTGGEGTRLSQIHALDLENDRVEDLGIMGTDPRYVPPGALIFAQEDQVLAVSFDLDRLEVMGSPIPVFDRVWIEESTMHLDVSSNGTVAYLPHLGDTPPQLLVVDRQGVSKDLVAGGLPFESFSDPRLSPDGTRVVVTANRLQVWMIDIPTETPTLLSESGFYPVWSIDGAVVTYGSTRNRSYDLFRIPVDLSRAEEMILDRENNLRTADMAPDGTLVFRVQIPGKGMDLRIWPDREDSSSIRPLLVGPDDELAAAVSPDGRWIAFVSDLSGQDEVYVTAYPNPAGRTQISAGGGASPAWGKDGREIFYMRRDALISAKITTDPALRVLSREELFTGSYLQYRWYRQYDVMPDGDHFLMILNQPRGNLEVVTNWFPELERALAAEE